MSTVLDYGSVPDYTGTKPIEAWYPYILPWVPGAPDTLVNQAIRSAAIDFCTRSDLVQRVITANVVADTQDYTITPPTDMNLARVLSVSWQGRVLAPTAPSVVQQDIVLRGAAVGTATPQRGDPYWFFQKTPTDGGFSLYPIPNTALTLGLTVKASFTPNNAATTLDQQLFESWAEDIAAGAIAILMSMPSQQFSSAKAADYGKAYNAAVTRAKRQAASGTLPSSLRVMPRRFA